MAVNKVILVGRAGKDPETRYMTSGEAVSNLSLATTEHYKDKSGAKQERTEWHNLVFYRHLAEVVGEYVKKGALLYVEGKLKTRKWQDKEGKDRYISEIVVNEMQMLGGKSSGEASSSQGAAPAASSSRPAPAANHQSSSGGGSSFPYSGEDDIPFAPFGKKGSGTDWRCM